MIHRQKKTEGRVIKQVTRKIFQDQVEELEKLSVTYGISQSVILTRMLDKYLKLPKKTKKEKK